MALPESWALVIYEYMAAYVYYYILTTTEFTTEQMCLYFEMKGVSLFILNKQPSLPLYIRALWVLKSIAEFVRLKIIHTNWYRIRAKTGKQVCAALGLEWV